MVFQSAMHALNPVYTIGRQLTDVLAAHRPDQDKRARRARAAHLLHMVGIPENRLSSYPHELSGGMRQRVMIGMALALEPRLVIMDEPTTALDVVTQREIVAELIRLRDRLGFAVLFITHDLSLLIELADSIAVMYAGKLVERAPAKRAVPRAPPPVHGRTAQLLPAHARRLAEADRYPRFPTRPAPPARRLSLPPPVRLRFEPCATEEPLLRTQEGEPERAVACWLHVQPHSAPSELTLVPAGEKR